MYIRFVILFLTQIIFQEEHEFEQNKKFEKDLNKLNIHHIDDQEFHDQLYGLRKQIKTLRYSFLFYHITIILTI